MVSALNSQPQVTGEGEEAIGSSLEHTTSSGSGLVDLSSVGVEVSRQHFSPLPLWWIVFSEYTLHFITDL